MEEVIKRRKRFKKVKPTTVITYVVLSLYLLFLFVPFLVILFTSFMSDAEIVDNGFHLFPKKFSIEGYELIFGVGTDFEDVPNLFLGFFNTFLGCYFFVFWSL